jgi:hypothetical protein
MYAIESITVQSANVFRFISGPTRDDGRKNLENYRVHRRSRAGQGAASRYVAAVESVQSASEAEFRTVEFQQRLWESVAVANIGLGHAVRCRRRMPIQSSSMRSGIGLPIRWQEPVPRRASSLFSIGVAPQVYQRISSEAPFQRLSYELFNASRTCIVGRQALMQASASDVWVLSKTSEFSLRVS